MKSIKGIAALLAYAALAVVCVYGAIEAHAARVSAERVERTFFGPAAPVDPYPGQKPTDYSDLQDEMHRMASPQYRPSK